MYIYTVHVCIDAQYTVVNCELQTEKSRAKQVCFSLKVYVNVCTYVHNYINIYLHTNTYMYVYM